MNIKILKALAAISMVMVLGACNKMEVNDNKVELNGEWLIRPLSAKKSNPTKVPGNLLATTISSIKLKEAPLVIPEDALTLVVTESWELSTEFSVPFSFYQMDNISLVLGNVKGNISVYINDKLVLESKTGSYFDELKIKDLLSRGKNKLRIVFNTENKKMEVQQMLATLQSYGIFELPYLQAWETAKIESVQFITDAVESNRAWITAVFNIKSDLYTEAYVTIQMEDNMPTIGGAAIQLIPGLNEVSIPFEIVNPKLWQTSALGTDIKYEPRCELIIENEPVNTLTSYLGIRTAIFSPDSAVADLNHFVLNNQIQELIGIQVNSLPAGKESEFAEMVHLAGFNLIQVNGFYAPEKFYNMCDNLGIMIGQELGNKNSANPNDSLYSDILRKEYTSALLLLRRHPCIIYYYTKSSGPKNYTENLTFKTIRETAQSTTAELDTQHPYFFFSPMQIYNLPKTVYLAVTDTLAIDSIEVGSEEIVNLPSYSSAEITFKYFGTPNTQKPTIPFFATNESDEKKLNEYIISNYSNAKYYQYLAYMSQIAQAELMIDKISQLKLSKNNATGAILIKYNNSLPGLNDSFIDFQLSPKAAYYKLKHRNNKLSIIISGNNFVKNIYVENNGNEPAEYQMQLNFIGFDGKVLYTEKQNISAKAKSTEYITKVYKQAIADKADINSTFLYIELTRNQEVICSEQAYFTKVKDMYLQNPEIKVDWLQTENKISCWLSSSSLAKNAVLEIKNYNGKYSNNFVDVIPGKPIEIIFTADSLPKNAKPEIEIFSMINAIKK